MAVVVRQFKNDMDQPANKSPAESMFCLLGLFFFYRMLTFFNLDTPPSLCFPAPVKDVRVDIDGEKSSLEKSLKTKRSLQKWKSFPNNGNASFKSTRSKKWTKNMYADILPMDGNPLPKLPEEEEVVGIITMEDVIEELLQVKLNTILSIIC